VLVHEHLDPEIDYHLVVDRPVTDHGVWTLHPMPAAAGLANQRRRGRTDPFPIIGRYDTGIWLDPDILLRGPLAPRLPVPRTEPDTPISGLRDPRHNTIAEAAKAAIGRAGGDAHTVRQQIERYEAEGFPRGAPVLESQFLIFDLTNPVTRAVFALWQRE